MAQSCFASTALAHPHLFKVLDRAVASSVSLQVLGVSCVPWAIGGGCLDTVVEPQPIAARLSILNIGCMWATCWRRMACSARFGLWKRRGRGFFALMLFCRGRGKQVANSSHTTAVVTRNPLVLRQLGKSLQSSHETILWQIFLYCGVWFDLIFVVVEAGSAGLIYLTYIQHTCCLYMIRAWNCCMILQRISMEGRDKGSICHGHGGWIYGYAPCSIIFIPWVGMGQLSWIKSNHVVQWVVANSSTTQSHLRFLFIWCNVKSGGDTIGLRFDTDLSGNYVPQWFSHSIFLLYKI